MSRRFVVFCCVLASTFSFAQSSSHKKVDPAKQAYVIEKASEKVRFEADGSSVREASSVIRIQSQGGLEAFGQLVMGYTSATEQLDITYVRVRKPNGQVVESSTANAQDFAPEILKRAPMYSDYREKHVSVSGLQVGDELEYATVTRETKPIVPGQFYLERNFSKYEVVNSQDLVVDVPKAVSVKLKSPQHPYETKEAADRRIYSWHIVSFLPNAQPDNSDEDEDAEEADFDPTPDVQLSTFADWHQVSAWYAKLTATQAAPDDAIRKKAAELTSGAKSQNEKMQRIYNFVALNIRYVSLSFGVGRYQPHLASEVLSNGYGDCKDKHTLLQALLQASDIPSYPVLIHHNIKLDPDVPSPAQFDHVITAVPVANGITWLDSTAEIAPFGMLLYSLRNKQALLASSDTKGGLVRTPADSPVKNVFNIKMDGKFTPSGGFDVAVELSLQGDSDLPVRSSFRELSQAQWDELLNVMNRGLGTTGKVSDIKASAVDDTSKPFQVRYKVHSDEFFRVPTNDARFFGVPLILLPKPPAKKKGNEPLDIGPAVERVYQAHIQIPENYSLTLPPAVTMTRDYGSFSANYSLEKGELVVERRVTLKVNELPATRRSDYESFRNAVGEPVGQIISGVITTPTEKQAKSSPESEGSPDHLRKAAATAMRQNDPATAANLLQKVVQQEPEHGEAWDELGLAQSRLQHHDEAVKAFRKQLELNAFHPTANRDLAFELEQQSKFDEAIPLYRKQLEISPSDKFAHKHLGLLLESQRNDQDAAKELETAASLSPDDPQIKLALSQVYARTGNNEKAATLSRAVTGSAPLKSGADLFSPALRDDIPAAQQQSDARNTLDQLGDQFDSGEYNRLGSTALSAMNLVALSWARMGWARYRQGEILDGMQFLNSAWLLSQSGTVGNRLAHLLQKEGQADKARHMFALAVAAGGDDAELSRQELLKLTGSPEAAQKEIANAELELLVMRTVKLGAVSDKETSAQFDMVFDSSTKPERVEFASGDEALRSAVTQLRDKDYPIRFPEVSSIKIVRRVNVSCEKGSCTAVLVPLLADSQTTGTTSAKQ